MKILLINPSFESSSGKSVSYGEPLGLLYVAASIEQSRRHQVEIIDCVADVTLHRKENKGIVRYGQSAEEVCSVLSRKKFDIIGITITKAQDCSDYIDRFITILKQSFPNTLLVGGGPEATLEYVRYCRPGLLDFVILGEGERAILELLDAIEHHTKLDVVKSLVYRDTQDLLHRTPTAAPLDIMELPRPARHLIPMKMYLKNRDYVYTFRSPAAAILTSRACPYDCTFCNVQVIWGRQWRARTAIDVVDEIEELTTMYGVREILIQDDNFVVDVSRVESIGDEILKRKLSISWHVQAGLHISHLNSRLLDKLTASGMYSLCVQIESCCQKTINYIHKKIDLQHAKDIVTYANRLGLFTQSNIILGFYFETEEHINESILTAEELGVDKINYILAIPKPHTQMFNDCLNEGVVSHDLPVQMPIDTLHFSGNELLQICSRANRVHYYIRLRQLFFSKRLFTELIPKVNSLRKLSYLGRRIIKEITL